MALIDQLKKKQAELEAKINVVKKTQELDKLIKADRPIPKGSQIITDPETGKRTKVGTATPQHLQGLSEEDFLMVQNLATEQTRGGNPQAVVNPGKQQLAMREIAQDLRKRGLLSPMSRLPTDERPQATPSAATAATPNAAPTTKAATPAAPATPTPAADPQAADRLLNNVPLMAMMGQEVRSQLADKGIAITPEEGSFAAMEAARSVVGSGQPVNAKSIIKAAIDPKIKESKERTLEELELSGKKADVALKTAKAGKELAEAGKLGAETQALTKTRTSDTQKRQIESERMLDQLVNVANKLNTKAFTFKGKLQTKIAQIMDRADVSTEDQQVWLDTQKEIFETLETVFQMRRSAITGAAASMKELENLRESVINTKLSPTELKASLRKMLIDTVIDINANSKLLSEGIDLRTLDPNAADAALNRARLDVKLAQREDIEKMITNRFPILKRPGERAAGAPSVGRAEALFVAQQRRKQGGR